MTGHRPSETKIILFTDLVDSTALLQRVGDEDARRVFEAHHEMLRHAVAATGGDEVKWLGDGLMVAFTSAADAVRCAVAMQQASRMHASGEHVRIRVGLHAGEALLSPSDYFGTHVVIARRLCDRAAAGQILCTEIVADLLSSRRAFTFRPIGGVELKGIEGLIATCEVLYENSEQLALFSETPFTGRANEMARLRRCFEEVRGGQGAVVMIAGEAGIGKTRMADEFLGQAAEAGAEVLRGSCYEGESGPPFRPFDEALKEHLVLDDVAASAPDAASPDDAPAAPPTPGERQYGQFELFERVARALAGLSMRAPVILMIDDLQWADDDTALMLRHVGRALAHHRVLIMGAYREFDVNPQHPLGGALVHLRRETRFEQLWMKGLAATEIAELLHRWSSHTLPHALVTRLTDETGGNPFFVREILVHLAEEGKLRPGEDRAIASTLIQDFGIPEGVRQVVAVRLSRLSAAANHLLSTASAFHGPFPFDVAAAVAELREPEALDALDEALGAGFLRRSREADRYEFSHVIVAHALYAELNPSRQARLHRRIAEAMERAYGGVSQFAGELAYQYHRSASIPGGDAAVPYALTAADQAARAYAWEDLVRFLRIAVDLMRDDDPRRLDVLARLGLTLPSTLAWQDAAHVARQVGEIVVASQGETAAAEYLADVVWAMVRAGGTFDTATWELAGHGLQFVPSPGGYAWARLACVDQWRRDAESSDSVGIALDNPVRAELRRVIETLAPGEQEELARHLILLPASRQDVLDRFPWHATYMTFWAGEYRRGVELWSDSVVEAERQVNSWAKPDALANLARCQLVLGDIEAARETLRSAEAIGVRPSGRYALTILSVRDDMRATLGEGWEQGAAELEALVTHEYPEQAWAFAAVRAAAARAFAQTGRRDDALELTPPVFDALDRANGSAANYLRIASNLTEVYWLFDEPAADARGLASIEKNIREKVLEADFRYPTVDARLSLARLAALERRYDDAADWFAQARKVLDEQGARPLRAIVDHDEAIMLQRRAAAGDADLAAELKAQALAQFRVLGMTGWAKRTAAIAPGTAPVKSDH